MKPIVLQMEAFGPYSGVQVIDFSLLKDANMFLIHGSTGGGKTTILDAICYALYGETSGKERDPESMRSHFAKSDQLTQVEFTFKVGQNTYFVHRIPGQKRPKKVGEGFTDQKPDAWLYKLGGQEPELLASGVTDVKDKVIELIGFDADQFRQVIIIPQGQFRKLLVAKSEERQKILGEIFQTRKYRQVEDKIRDEERTLKNDVASIKERRKEQIKNIKYRPGTLLEELIAKENIDTSQVITEVEVLGQTQLEEIRTIASEIKVAEDKLRKLSAQITTAVNNNAKHKEKETVKAQYDEIKSQESTFIAKEKAYHLGQKALPFKTKEQYIADLKGQKDTTEKDLASLNKAIEALVADHERVKAQMEKCQEEEPKVRQMALKLNKAVEEYRPKSTNLISLETSKAAIAKDIEKAANRQKALKVQKETLTKDIKENETSLSQGQTFNDQLRKQELKAQQLAGVLGQKRQLAQLEKAHKALQAQYKTNVAALAQAEQAYGRMSDDHNTALQQWIKGQAGELAKNLKDDQACPVCGSVHHPNPATTINETPTEQVLEAKKKALDQALAAFQKAQSDKVEIMTKGEESGEWIRTQKEALGDYADTPLEEIEQNYQTNKKQKKATEETLLALKNLQEKVVKQKADLGEIDRELEALQEKDKENADKFTALTTQVDQIKREIPQELRDKEALDAYIAGLEQGLKNYQEVYDQTSKELERVSTAKVQAETRLKENQGQLKAIVGRYERETTSFQLEREQVGFPSFEAYKEAYKSQDELDHLSESIKAYRNRYSAVEAQYKRLEEETKGIALVDVEALEEAYSRLEQEKDKLARAEQTISLEKQHNQKQLAIIQASNKQIQDKEKRYAIVGNLYDAVRGKNIKGISFERFIQSSLFEDVLIRANERLGLMSNNRYELYRSDNRESLAAQSGLDMEVLDTYTGKKRHVRTLSGGEGFMASLSLALGLADVVQSYAGGISLDTIFIDEGFGTLDTESLDAAIKTLIDLQQSGRLVGIISHVPELKERIGARLEVTTTQNGSTAAFHV